jgi:hypothetical protein
MSEYKYKFSIIVPHYDGVISDEFFIQGMQCLKNQTFKDFEVLIYHDGPTSRPIPDVDIPNSIITITKKRYNDWGHSLRDMGIRVAKGEYIVHFNPDNILYDTCLEELDKLSKIEIKQQPTSEILIYPILMKGMQTNGLVVWREKSQADKKHMIFTGFPTIKYNIDCMQLVMRTRTWLGFGGWQNKAETSDGDMYPKFVQIFGARYCNKILGEHR